MEQLEIRSIEAAFLKLEDQIKRPKRIVSLNEKIEKIRKNILAKSKLIIKSKLDKISVLIYPNYWLLQSEKIILFQIENFFPKKRKNLLILLLEKLKMICSMN